MKVVKEAEKVNVSVHSIFAGEGCTVNNIIC